MEYGSQEVLRVFSNLLGSRDPYTVRHSLRVAKCAWLIARSMNCSGEMVNRTYAAATLHDVGKTFIPMSILNKPAKLTKHERRTIESHALAGYSLLNQYAEYRHIAEIVLHHHERYDGLGYPFGLKKNHIPLESRIISVADAFDAITSDRSYHDALSRHKALLEITQNARGMFDPEVVDHFARLLKHKAPQLDDYADEMARFVNISGMHTPIH